jgi:hypothetical protein
MIRYLARRTADGLVSLALLTLIFEGPTLLAVARSKLSRR